MAVKEDTLTEPITMLNKPKSLVRTEEWVSVKIILPTEGEWIENLTARDVLASSIPPASLAIAW